MLKAINKFHIIMNLFLGKVADAIFQFGLPVVQCKLNLLRAK